MSVQKFTTSNVTNLEAFKTWLDEYSSEGFLQNITITLSTTVSANDTITFTGVNNSVIFKTFAYGYVSSGTTNNILTCETISGDAAYIYNQDNGYARQNSLSGAMLCNNGLILRVYLRSRSNNDDFNTTEYVMITKDSEGNLAIIIPKNDGNGNSYNNISTKNIGFRAICYDQSKTASGSAAATFNETKTTLSPIVLDSINLVTLPNVYQILQNEMTGIDFTDFTISSDTFITNGYWAVKD